MCHRSSRTRFSHLPSQREQWHLAGIPPATGRHDAGGGARRRLTYSTMKPRSTSSRRGFTLIELLVVIAIIGILSSIVLASLNTARQKSKNARSIADLRQLQNALELYYSDHNAYPLSNGWNGLYSCWGDSR